MDAQTAAFKNRCDIQDHFTDQSIGQKRVVKRLATRDQRLAVSARGQQLERRSGARRTEHALNGRAATRNHDDVKVAELRVWTTSRQSFERFAPDDEVAVFKRPLTKIGQRLGPRRLSGVERA